MKIKIYIRVLTYGAYLRLIGLTKLFFIKIIDSIKLLLNKNLIYIRARFLSPPEIFNIEFIDLSF